MDGHHTYVFSSMDHRRKNIDYGIRFFEKNFAEKTSDEDVNQKLHQEISQKFVERLKG